MSNGARFSSCAYNVPDDPYDTLTSTACAALKRAITSPIAAFRSDAAATRTVDRAGGRRSAAPHAAAAIAASAAHAKKMRPTLTNSLI